MIISNQPDREIPNNRIRTSKYTFLSFIPLNLFEQFSKLANVYFLVIAVLQTIQVISITQGVPVILGPLAIVVAISMAKDFIEDFKRHRSDNEENNRKTEVLRQGAWTTATWESILVGDVVRVKQDEYFCADVLLLSSSEKKGVCYVETKNLDGETNLKNKQAPKEVMHMGTQNPELIWSERIQMQYEKPNPFLYKFLGSIDFKGKRVALDQNNFILRGCSLRNSRWCLGLVAYNGHDTKIMLNSVKARPKRSRLELMMNVFIIIIFCIQMLCCAFAAMMANIWIKSNINQLPYLEIKANGTDNDLLSNFFIKWGNWILIFTNFVPISLLVTLEMVKFFQGIAIALDSDTKSSNGIIATVQSSNLNEELGQVSYVFSDKTGTLTQNLMDFKSFTVGGKSYGDNHSVKFHKDEENNFEQNITNIDYNDRRYIDDMKKADDQSQRLKEFMLCLAFCHTIITTEEDNRISYNASSPDELALVNLARYLGYKFQGIDEHNVMRVFCEDRVLEYHLLHVLEFDSTRKRMSVIVRDDRGEVILYCKGADSIIEKRLHSQIDHHIKEATWDHLKQYASIGLRTLLLAKRVIQPSEFNSWNDRYLQACAQIEGRDHAMDQLQDEIEQHLELLGGTAIEDKLQDDVGPTIQSLKNAGIQVWVLTGDKIETAINIGFSCQLLTDQQEQILIDAQVEEDLRKQIDNAKEKVKEKTAEFAIIVSGDSLIHISQSEYLKNSFIQIAQSCNAVLACRVSPKQKQEIVTMVRIANPQVTTLAIGDGANDVNMITAAHVGIGIRGVEGQQAARASDYAIGEFKILRRLLLYHGREAYRKNSRLVLYNFFKNLMLVLPQFWYGFTNGFSGVSLYDSYMYQCYNLFFTSLPIVVYAIFDEEHTPSTLMRNPSYYKQGPLDLLFNKSVYLFWLGFSALQAMVVGLLTYPMLETVAITSHGWMGCFFSSGTSVLGYAVYNGNLKVLLFSNTHTIASLTINVLSTLTFVLTYLILSGVSLFNTVDIYNTFSWTYGTLTYYLATLAIIGVTTLSDMCLTRWSWFLSNSSMKVQPKEDSGQMIELGQKPNVNELSPYRITANTTVIVDERNY